MSYGKTEIPCSNYRAWIGQEPLCGNCGWNAEDHSSHDPIAEQKARTLKENIRILLFKHFPEKLDGEWYLDKDGSEIYNLVEQIINEVQKRERERIRKMIKNEEVAGLAIILSKL